MRFEKKDYRSIYNLPRLSAGFLVRHGFQQDGYTPKGFKTRGTYVAITQSDPYKLNIFTIDDSGPLLQEIYFRDFCRGKIYVPAFMCPVRLEYCTSIYYDGLFWASREAHRLSAEQPFSQRGAQMLKLRDRLIGTPARGRSKGDLWRQHLDNARRELDRLKIVPNSWWDLESVFNHDVRLAQSNRRAQLRSARPDELTLAWAIEHGQRETCEWPMVAPSPKSPDFWLKKCFGDPARLSALVEDHASIDLSTIQKRGWLDDRSVVCWRLGWLPELTEGLSAMLIVDGTKTGLPELRIEFSRGHLPQPVHQVIQVMERPHMPGRLFLQCPALGSAHQKLYFRDGFFASAKAQSLEYRSKGN